MCLLWGADLTTLLADVNHPGSQEDVVSNWEPAPSLAEDAGLWGRDCPLPSGSGCHMPAFLPPVGGGTVHSCLALLWYSLNALFCQQARLCIRLEPFSVKFSLFFLALPQFGLLSHVSSLRLSPGLAFTLSLQPAPPCAAPAHWLLHIFVYLLSVSSSKNIISMKVGILSGQLTASISCVEY